LLLAHLVSILVSLSVISVLFAMMFNWLPDAAVDWDDVWLCAILSAVLFDIGKSAIGFYIGKQGWIRHMVLRLRSSWF
jgi:membrane protein